MKMLATVFCLALATGVQAFPTRLTEEQFLSATNDADATPVGIVSGYAQIRRQGRNFGASGDKIKFSNKPVTVKDPSQFVPAADAKRAPFDDEKAPVFSLEKMIQEEAEKLKIQVEVASLMAAHAAEEAAAHIKAAAANAAQDAEIATAEVDKIIENAVDSAIREAEEIVGSEVESAKQEEEEASTEKAVDVSNDVPAEETTSQKSANVEWSAPDDQTLETATEAEQKAVEVKEADVVTDKIEEEKPTEAEPAKAEEPAEEEVKSAEESPKSEEGNSTEQPEDNKLEDDDADESSRVQTTETAHPPQDLDLGSVQEV